MKILTLDEIRNQAPAAFATQPNPKVSKRYGFISTVETLKAYENLGWFPVKARQSFTRIESNRPYTRHEITFARPDEKPIEKLGDVSPRIRLLNSHGTESTWNNIAELCRMICSNGLVVSMGSAFDFRVRHTMSAVENITETIGKIGEAFPMILSKAEAWSQLRLGDGKILALGASALTIRYGQDESKWPAKPEAIALTTRRSHDVGNDLWTVFNRIQENVTRNGNVPTEKVNNRRRSIRTIRSIDADLTINKKLWEAAEQLALSA
jgi:hypothetical protein